MTDRCCVPSCEEYVARIRRWYVQLPETLRRCRRQDLLGAAEPYRRGVDLETVECALLLGSLRRLGRSSDCPPLGPIRSLAYFLPVVEELVETPSIQAVATISGTECACTPATPISEAPEKSAVGDDRGEEPPGDSRRHGRF